MEDQTPQPTPQELLFARAIILTFELWPAMRLAVAEEWGGPDSKDKRDYLISYLCDEHPATNEPDLDDLAEVLETYIIDEFECRLDDGSSDWVAGRLVGMHRVIFKDQMDKAQAAVAQLQEAAEKLKGKKTSATAGPHEDQQMDDEERAHRDAEQMVEGQGGVMEADRIGDQAGQEQRARGKPEIDEDGFETVTSRRRR